MHCPTDERLGCISLLALMNGAGRNIHVEVSVGDATGSTFGFIPRTSIVRSYGNFNFLSKL